MNIRILGAHNRESQNTRLSSLVVDDVLALDAGGLTSGLSLAAQQKLKAFLLSHHHYDHIRDVPALAMNFYLAETNINIYSTVTVFDVLTNYLFDGKIYPNFLERPQGNPTIKFTVLETLKPEVIEGYSVLAVPVKHSVPSVGYQVSSPDGKVLFYAADTGPGLADCWRRVNPQLLIIEVTASASYQDPVPGHLNPALLRQELVTFREMKGFLPVVITVHMDPEQETEIKAELADVAEELNCQITPGYEGMLVSL